VEPFIEDDGCSSKAHPTAFGGEKFTSLAGVTSCSSEKRVLRRLGDTTNPQGELMDRFIVQHSVELENAIWLEKRFFITIAASAAPLRKAPSQQVFIWKGLPQGNSFSEVVLPPSGISHGQKQYGWGEAF